MANFIAGVLLVTYLLLTTDGARMKLMKYIWLNDIRSCPGKQLNSSIVGYLGHVDNGTFYLNLDVKCDKTMKNLFFRVALSKCPTRFLSDRCELMMSFPVGDQCNVEDAFFRYMYSQFKPKIECPVKKGTYIGRNIILNPEKYSTFFRGIEDHHWLYVMMEISGAENFSEIEICLALTAAIRKMRVRVEN